MLIMGIFFSPQSFVFYHTISIQMLETWYEIVFISSFCLLNHFLKYCYSILMRMPFGFVFIFATLNFAQMVIHKLTIHIVHKIYEPNFTFFQENVSFVWNWQLLTNCANGLFVHLLRASPPVLSMWPSTLKSDEEKSKYAGLSHKNGFVPAYVLSLLRLVKGTAKRCTC
jgi:hypothetical protein